MRGEHVPETEEYEIGALFIARKPFHPRIFYEFLHSKVIAGKLIRSKGYFWLATRPEFAGQWNQAGGIARYGFGGLFWKAVPKSQWPDNAEYLASIQEDWVEPFGDMRQELVFIGQGLNEDAITRMLDDCLISDAYLLAGKARWLAFDDPFPVWDQPTVEAIAK